MDFTGGLGGVNSALGQLALGYDVRNELLVVWVGMENTSFNPEEFIFPYDEGGHPVVVKKNWAVWLSPAQVSLLLAEHAKLIVVGENVSGYMAIPKTNPIKFTVSFYDAVGLPFDPLNALIQVDDPRGDQIIYTGANLTKLGIGQYLVIVEANIAGTWTARGQGETATGYTVSTQDVSVTVEPSFV